jgi:protein gp37
MMSKIPWTQETINPIIGCSKISAGCQNCYAERMACRLGAMGNTDYLKVAYKPGTMISNFTRWGWTGKTAIVESQLDKPFHWKKPRTIFVCSMGDLFHETVRQCWLHEVLNVIHKTPQHTYQILTKRPERFFEHELKCSKYGWDYSKSLPKNIWMGVTAENQEMLKQRERHLREIPAAVRFVSLEPLLGPIDFKKIYGHDMMCCVQCGYVGDEPYETDYETPDDPEGWPICPECGETNCGGYNSFDKIGVTPFEMRPFPKIDWVIVGCESGQNRRECKLEWVKRIVEQCTEEDVPVFVKQLPINGKVSKNMAEWPERLRRRETPVNDDTEI